MLLLLFLVGTKILVLSFNKGFIIKPPLLNLIFKDYTILFLAGPFLKGIYTLKIYLIAKYP